MAWAGLFRTRWVHARVHEDLSAYLDGALRPTEARRVVAHLADCPACRAELEGLRAVKAAVQALPRPSPRRSFVLNDPAVVPPRRPATQRLERRYAFARVASGALAVVLLLLLGFDFVMTSRFPSGPAGSTVARSLPETVGSGAVTPLVAAPAIVPDERVSAMAEASVPAVPAAGAVFPPTALSRSATPSPAVATGGVSPTVVLQASPAAAPPRDIQAEATSALPGTLSPRVEVPTASPEGLAAGTADRHIGLRVVEAALAVGLAGTLVVTALLRRSLAQVR